MSDKCRRQYLLNPCVRNRNVQTYNRSARLFELLVIKHRILCVADELFSVKDINDCTALVFYTFFFSFSLFADFYFYMCTFMYDFNNNNNNNNNVGLGQQCDHQWKQLL